MKHTTNSYDLPERPAGSGAMTAEQSDDSLVDAALGELDAVRAHIDTLGWDDTESTGVLRRLRDERDAQLDAVGGYLRPVGDDSHVEAD